MTKQELLSSSAFQKASDDAFIYLVAWIDDGPWIRHISAPKKEDQTQDCICFRSFEPAISKIRLLTNPSFRHSRGDKVLTIQYLYGWHKTERCDVDIDPDGDIVISEKKIKEEDYAR